MIPVRHPASPRRSLLAVRMTAAAPRAALFAAVAILAAAALRGIIRPAARPLPPPPPAPARDLAAEAFAQSFARAYLSWDSADQDGYDARVGGYLAASLTADTELAVPARGSQRVTWTQVVADDRSAQGHRTVIVEAQAGGPPQYVAVPVGRDAAGALFVAGYPALVGPPATNPNAATALEQEVSDPDLETVVRRALGNYLSAQMSNLRADLTPGAAVSPPTQPLTLRSLDHLTWAAAGTAAAVVTAATGDGTVLALRYELGVVKRDRWYVTAVEADPRKEGD
jgi:hypothetical protein